MMTAEELATATLILYEVGKIAAVLDNAQNTDEVVERAMQEYFSRVDACGDKIALEMVARAIHQNGVISGWSEVQEDPQAFGLDGNPEA